jgi:hypothetical protein
VGRTEAGNCTARVGPASGRRGEDEGKTRGSREVARRSLLLSSTRSLHITLHSAAEEIMSAEITVRFALDSHAAYIKRTLSEHGQTDYVCKRLTVPVHFIIISDGSAALLLITYRSSLFEGLKLR